MKLATYKDGSRDGQLVVVSRDLSQAHFANGIANHLQQVLDDWGFLSPQLEDLTVTLNHGRARHAFAFDPRQCMAPLPRASHWACAQAYPGAAGKPSPQAAAPMLQCAADDLLGAHDPAWFGSPRWQIDFEAGLAVATSDVAMGASPAQALDGVRLLLLCNSWRLRSLMSAQAGAGQAPLQGLAAAAFAPVAVTPDELGDAWQGGRLHGTLHCSRNGRKLGQGETGPGMAWHFGELLAQLAMTRNLRAGCLVGSGPVRVPVNGPQSAQTAQAVFSLLEARTREAAEAGTPKTTYFCPGETLHIEFKGRDGQSVFGAMDQTVTGPQALAEVGAGTAVDAAGSEAVTLPAKTTQPDLPNPGSDPP